MTRTHCVHTQPVGFTFYRTLELQALAGEPGLYATGAGTRARTATFSTGSGSNALKITVVKSRPWIRFIKLFFWAFGCPRCLSLVFGRPRETPQARRGRGGD